MSSSKNYLRNQKSSNNSIMMKEKTQPLRNFNKIATLDPYLADIEKKRLKKNKVNKTINNESSSKSFRIKQLSSSSLHKLGIQKRQKSITTATLIQPHKLKINNDVKQRKARSQNRVFQSSFSKTINTKKDQGKQKDKNNYFNDYFLRIKNKPNGTAQKFRKNLYQPVVQRKNSSSQANHQNNQLNIQHNQLNIQHNQLNNNNNTTKSNNNQSNKDMINEISYTDVHIDRNKNLTKQNQQIQLANARKTQNVRRNNFRRNKYQNLHFSVNQKPQIKSTQDTIEPLHSQRLYGLNKKQSNLTINEEMDLLAQKEMANFYRQIRTKQIQKSLQKSTQMYFGSDSYRPVKSKNQIQLYVSSMQNPSLNKVSQSTYDKSDNLKSPIILKNPIDCYAYNFDFEVEKKLLTNEIYEMENPSEQQSSINNFNDLQFQAQRRNAEVQFFHKVQPNLDISDDNCQVDDL